jgi:Large polyvalent protein associated domain 29
MSTTEYRSPRYLTCAETAKLLRAQLKRDFPGQKFSVRSDTYAGGASIRVRWTDGPKRADVDKVCQLYAGASFDGMIDLKSYHTSWLRDEEGEPQEVHFGADFVFTDRDVSPERDARIKATVERGTRVPFSFDAVMPEGWYTDDAGVLIPGHALAYGRYGRDFYNALREVVD